MDRMTAVVHQSGAQRHAGLPESGRCMTGEVQRIHAKPACPGGPDGMTGKAENQNPRVPAAANKRLPGPWLRVPQPVGRINLWGGSLRSPVAGAVAARA